jgi:hypothetical protein
MEFRLEQTNNSVNMDQLHSLLKRSVGLVYIVIAFHIRKSHSLNFNIEVDYIIVDVKCFCT